MVFESEKTYNHFILDAGYKELLKLAKQTPGYVQRSKSQILSYYQGTDKDGTVRFMTPSGTTPGLYYLQKIKLVDLPKLLKKYKNSKTARQIIVMAVQGNLKVSCNDPIGKDEPSWLYWGFKYKGTVGNYASGREKRFPEIRNPKLKGSVCKHLHQVLTNLPFHISQITRDLQRLGKFEEERTNETNKSKKG